MNTAVKTTVTILFLCSLIFCISKEASSQRFYATFFAGASNYSGDLQENPFTFKQAHPAGGAGLAFELNDHIFIHGALTLGKVSADDKYGKNYKRNLNFYSNIYEFSLQGEYIILNPYRWTLSPYAFVGIAVYDFAPYSKDLNGVPVLLPEKSTEGQGFVPGREDYKLRQFSIPFGGGLMWNISYKSRISVFAGFRKTFTDYIDDVSTTYVDEDLLIQNRGLAAAEMAYRGDQLPNGAPYPPAGTVRGNPKSLDMYYFVGVGYRVRLFGSSKRKMRMNDDGIYRGKKGQIGCPRL